MSSRRQTARPPSCPDLALSVTGEVPIASRPRHSEAEIWKRAMCLTQVAPTSWGAALSPPIPVAREGAASRYTGLSAALLAERAMQFALPAWRPRCARPTAHRPQRKRANLDARRNARTTICRGYLSQAHSPHLEFRRGPNHGPSTYTTVPTAAELRVRNRGRSKAATMP